MLEIEQFKKLQEVKKFVFPKVDMSKISTNSLKKSEDALPKMDELIQAGVVSIGDELYITIKPNEFNEILIDSKNVIFNEERFTLKECRCKVTGW
ncbi:MAG: hypothetical protein ACI311_01410 [Bacilli bacterium]